MGVYIVVDIEADGPIPGDYSMTEIGAVVVEDGLKRTFYAQLRPISERWDATALAVSGKSREQTLAFEDPKVVMQRFHDWIIGVQGNSKHIKFVSDNNGFDWMFVCWYFHHFLQTNPFGWSSENLNSLFKGCERDMWKSFKHLRITKHTHHPVDDAKGNAEAMLAIKSLYNVKGI